MARPKSSAEGSVWWRNNAKGKWVRYPNSVAKEILHAIFMGHQTVDLGGVHSKPEGDCSYLVDFGSMEELNTGTGQRRRIYIVPTKKNEKGVWWWNEVEWVSYPESISSAVKRGIANRAATVDLGIIRSYHHKDGDHYKADLTRMEQYNVRTGYRRKMTVVVKEETKSLSQEEKVALVCAHAA